MNHSTSKLPSTDHPGTSIPRALKLFLLLLIGLFLFEWSFALIHRFFLHSAYPYTTPLFDSKYRFADWQYMVMRTRHFGQPGFLLREDFGPRFSYPAPCLYIYVFFVRAFTHSTTAMLTGSILLLTSITALLSRYLHRLHAGILFQAAAWLTLLLGNPTWFLVDRGNIEAFLWFPLALGMVAFLADRPYLAAICFAFPVSMKLYPALFLLLFLPRRQYKAFFLSAAATVGIFLAAFAGIGPTLTQAISDMAVNGRLLRDVMLVSSAARIIRWDHTLFALEKQIVYQWALFTHRATESTPPLMYGSLHVYTILMPVLFLLLYVLRLRKLPLLNQFAAFAICSVLLPWLSYEYTLIYLYLVWGIFLIYLLQDVVTHRVRFSASRLYLIVVCFALLVAPITAATFENFSGQVKALGLLTLLTIFSAYPMPSTLLRDLPPTQLAAP